MGNTCSRNQSADVAAPAMAKEGEVALSDTEKATITNNFNAAFPSGLEMDRFDEWIAVVKKDVVTLGFLDEVADNFDEEVRSNLNEKNVNTIDEAVTLEVFEELKKRSQKN